MATGRKTVAPGQTITSQWGNLVWDQSVQNFASTADRDTQFPAPLDGAICYTAAEKTWWVRVGGVWKSLFNDWPKPPVWRTTRTSNGSVGAGVWGTAAALVISNAPPGAYAATGVALCNGPGSGWVRITANGANLPDAAQYGSSLANLYLAQPITGCLPNHPGGSIDWNLGFGFGDNTVTANTGTHLQVTYLGPN